MPLAKPQQEDPRAPIKWSADSKTIESVLSYCETEYYRVKKTQYGAARQGILARIHGNLRNANHRAYNGHRDFGEVSYESVARELTKHCEDSPVGLAEKNSYLTALDTEWDVLSAYFKRTFVKAEVD